MSNLFRNRVFQKLAQTSVSGAPPQFQSLFPSINIGFSATIVNQITQLSNYLNNVLFYLSEGKYNISQLYNNLANINTSSIVDQDLKKIVEFSKLVIQHLYNNKFAFQKPLSNDEVRNRIDLLLNSQFLNNLANTNPTGQLAIKTNGNVKTNIKNFLQNIKNSIGPTSVATPVR